MLRMLFRKPKASIDFITISIPHSLNTNALCREFDQAIKGRIELPKGRNKDWITIHDPHTADLQWLLDNHPEAQMRGIEVAVDFTLQDDSNDHEKLAALHGWLKTRLYPQRHASMAQVGRRKYYDARTGQIVPDALRTKSGNETVYWTNPNAYEQVRLYIKTHDNKVPVKGQHPVRLEATLFGGGCQNAGLYRVADLPDFADQLRRYLSKFLYVAAGIKPKLRRTRANTPERAAKAAHEASRERARVSRAWQIKGAEWAAKRKYDTTPDTATNRLIGAALKTLRDDLMSLKLTRKVAEHPGYEVLEKPVDTGDDVASNLHCIEGQRSLSQSDSSRSSPTPDEQREQQAPDCKLLPAESVSQINTEKNVCTSTT